MITFWKFFKWDRLFLWNIQNIYYWEDSKYSGIPKPEIVIGEGSFGRVFRVAKKSSGKEFAILFGKEEGDSELEQAFLSEMEVLAQVRYHSILSLYGRVNSYPYYIITEYLSKGSVQKYIDLSYKGETPEIWDLTHKFIVILGIALGMRFLHSLNIAHRDWKPGNMLLDDNLYPRIADFGLSKH